MEDYESSPFDGTNRFKFQGYNLSPVIQGTPLEWMAFATKLHQLFGNSKILFFFVLRVEFFRSYVSYKCMTRRKDIERLFKAYYPQLYRLAGAILHDDDQAGDIVHDVFASLIDGNELSAVTPGYLMRAVRNRCLNHIRDCDLHQRIAHRYFLENEEYEMEEWPDEETLSRIDSLIKTELSPQSRRIMQLRFSEGMRFAAIASTMGISQTAVFRHLGQALNIIRKKLNENG